NLDRVHLITGAIDDEGRKRGFDPAVDMIELQTAMALKKPRLLILDPISSAVSGESHQNTEVRRSLQPVVDLASSLGCAVLGITHFSKGTAGRDPLERVTGSMAFGAFARLVWATIKPAKDADDQKRRLIRTKSNIGPDGGGFEYDLKQTNVPGFSDIYASCILWGDALEGSARELAGQIEDEKTETGPSPREEAKEFLLDILNDGPRLQVEIKDLSDQEGISIATLKRAKKELGIISTKLSEGWEWRLKNWVQPDQGDQEDQILKVKKIDTLDTLADTEITVTNKNQTTSHERQGDQGDHVPNGELVDGDL
ncbi:MAG: AAA family ATPase, partial [Desulfobulbus sp.]